jgi:hypothetical protein
MQTRVSITLAILASMSACKNPRYCEDNPGHDCELMWDAASEGASCATNDQCSAPTSVCDIAALTCVQCIAPNQTAACTGTTPACGGDQTCHACSTHADCSSGACLPDGSCGSDANVAYVDPGGTDNASCTKQTPCTKVAKALATSRAFIKFHGTTDEAVTISNRDVTLLADVGAKLTRGTAGVILTIDGTSNVTIYSLTISGGLGSTGIGVSMPAGNSSTLTMKRAIVEGNGGGGLSITGGRFDITNTLIVKNGAATSGLGGVFVSQANSGLRVFEFNTVAQNTATAGITAGVLCAAIASPIAFKSSIVFANGAGMQVEGNNCSWSYSDIGPTAVTGNGNVNGDPAFANPALSNFHLTSGSPAKDIADPSATLPTDMDGDVRPQGAGRDMGADEFK